MLGERLRERRRDRKFLKHAIVVGNKLIREGESTRQESLQRAGEALVVASFTVAAKQGFVPRVRLKRARFK